MMKFLKILKKFVLIIILLVISSSAITSCSIYHRGPMSDHFDGKRFFDPENPDTKTFVQFLKWQFTKKSVPWPDHVAVESYDQPPERVYGNELRVSNVGHVTFLIQTQGLNILTDPVWSDRASPVSFAGPKRIIDPGVKFEALPPIDLVWISHNHYDHLDIETIKNLWNTHKPRIITPLGNDTIIHSYDDKIQVEAYDWGDSVLITEEVKFHIEPMQHWSARGLFDRNKALWAALVIETNGGNIYFVGDSGYGEGRYFKRAKEKYGNFRLALLPMGAYEPRWFMKYAHMNPEEMVNAHWDLGGPWTVPSHYDVFKLTDEGMGEASKALEEVIYMHRGRYSTMHKINVMKVGESWLVPEEEQ